MKKELVDSVLKVLDSRGTLIIDYVNENTARAVYTNNKTYLFVEYSNGILTSITEDGTYITNTNKEKFINLLETILGKITTIDSSPTKQILETVEHNFASDFVKLGNTNYSLYINLDLDRSEIRLVNPTRGNIILKGLKLTGG